METVLITGANGLLATNIIIELLLRGFAVKGLLRSIEKFNLPGHPNLQLLQGDITDEAFLEKALKGSDYVIHTAAVTDQNLPDYSDYRRVNVIAAENLIRLASAEKVKRFIYIGSANTSGYGSVKKPGSEKTGIKEPFADSYYSMSKLEGQQMVLKFKDKIDVLVISPTFMIGPYDSKPASGQIIYLGYKKRLIFYPPGGKNFVHVQDVAIAVVNALTKGKAGEIYLLANENLSYREFFRKLADVTGFRPVLVKAPGFILLMLGFIGNMIRWMGFKTSFTMANMKILCVKSFYSNQKAVEELGIEFQPAEKAIADAIAWFKEKNMI